MAFTVTIKPRTGWVGINFRELWLYRELLYIFAWRDIKVRYKQTVIGILWAILQPLLLMIVFSYFFGTLAKIPSNGIPYPIFVYSGLLFWNYFSTALSSSSNCLIDNENMIKKIYFPRLLLPLSTSVTPAIDFLFAFLVLFGLMFFFHFPIHWTMIFIPVLLLLTFFVSAGIGTLLATLNVRYRDIRYALPFFIQFLLFVTPVIYPVTLVPEKFHWLLALNPMTGIIQTARSIIIGGASIDWALLGTSFVLTCFIFLLSLFLFRKNETIFADIA